MSELQKKVDMYVAQYNGARLNQPTCDIMEMRVQLALRGLPRDRRFGGFYVANVSVRPHLDDIPEEDEILEMLSRLELAGKVVFVKNHNGKLPPSNQQNITIEIDERVFAADWRGGITRPLMDPNFTIRGLFRRRLNEEREKRNGEPLPLWPLEKGIK